VFSTFATQNKIYDITWEFVLEMHNYRHNSKATESESAFLTDYPDDGKIVAT
jgi:hypothetical protein